MYMETEVIRKGVGEKEREREGERKGEIRGEGDRVNIEIQLKYPTQK